MEIVGEGKERDYIFTKIEGAGAENIKSHEIGSFRLFFKEKDKVSLKEYIREVKKSDISLKDLELKTGSIKTDIEFELEKQGILVSEFKLYAKWQQINKYEITFDLLGGHWEEQTLDNFINELIYYFQIPYNGDNDSSYFKQTTKETFLKNSRPNINIVWYDAFTLNKYLWLFDFLKAEINTYAAAWDKANNYTYYVPSQKILEYMTERVDGKMKDSAGAHARLYQKPVQRAAYQ